MPDHRWEMGTAQYSDRPFLLFTGNIIHFNCNSYKAAVTRSADAKQDIVCMDVTALRKACCGTRVLVTSDVPGGLKP